MRIQTNHHCRSALLVILSARAGSLRLHRLRLRRTGR